MDSPLLLSVKGSAGATPAFIRKLWDLLNDPSTDDLIRWNEETDGTTFIVEKQAKFAEKILPRYFKHNNMSSFIRQLNMYGFHKVPSMDQGSLHSQRDLLQFSHDCFRLPSPELLQYIKRRNVKDDVGGKPSKEDVSRALVDIGEVRKDQGSLMGKFQTMKEENRVLWRKVAGLEEKLHKQQLVINKVFYCLFTLAKRRATQDNLKRSRPLAIQHTSAADIDEDDPPMTRRRKLPAATSRGITDRQIEAWPDIDAGDVIVESPSGTKTTVGAPPTYLDSTHMELALMPTASVASKTHAASLVGSVQPGVGTSADIWPGLAGAPVYPNSYIMTTNTAPPTSTNTLVTPEESDFLSGIMSNTAGPSSAARQPITYTVNHPQTSTVSAPVTTRASHNRAIATPQRRATATPHSRAVVTPSTSAATSSSSGVLSYMPVSANDPSGGGDTSGDNHPIVQEFRRSISKIDDQVGNVLEDISDMDTSNALQQVMSMDSQIPSGLMNNPSELDLSEMFKDFPDLLAQFSEGPSGPPDDDLSFDFNDHTGLNLPLEGAASYDPDNFLNNVGQEAQRERQGEQDDEISDLELDLVTESAAIQPTVSSHELD